MTNTFNRNDGTFAQVDYTDVSSTPTIPAAAAQSDQETGTSTTTYVSPGRQQFHKSAAKAWAYVTVAAGTPTLTTTGGSLNITSITDSGAGVLDIAIATDFSTVNWSGVAITADSGGVPTVTNAGAGVRSAGADRITSRLPDGTLTDPSSYSFAGFGDQ